MKWLYELPEESRREIIRLQTEREIAVCRAMSSMMATEREAARRIVAKCNKKIEQIAKGAAVL